MPHLLDDLDDTLMVPLDFNAAMEEARNYLLKKICRSVVTECK